MTITFRPAKRESVGLVIGLVGASGGGKTFTAMRLASGIAGDRPFAVIDTEAGRAKHYADRFRFDHADLHPPFAPSVYQEAIVAADKAGYPVIVVDSFSHEHAGEGGILDMQEQELKRLGGGDNVKMLSWVKPKGEHRRMVSKLLQCRAHLILCMRAEDKIEIIKVGNETKVRPKETLAGFKGWIPICEKNLPYELTVSILLLPDKPGVPQPIKVQEQHRDLFPLDKPITEDTGAKLAAWARGGATESTTAPGNRAPASTPAEPRAQEVDGRVGGQLLHDIKRELTAAYPGTTPAMQAAKAGLLGLGFGTRQWANVERLPTETLRRGLEKIRAELKQLPMEGRDVGPAAVAGADRVGDGAAPLGEAVRSEGPPMTDEAELNAAMNQWDPVPSPETRRKIFRGVFGTDDLSKVDIAAAFDAIDLFKRVAEKDAAAIAEVNKYLKAA